MVHLVFWVDFGPKMIVTMSASCHDLMILYFMIIIYCDKPPFMFRGLLEMNFDKESASDAQKFLAPLKHRILEKK